MLGVVGADPISLLIGTVSSVAVSIIKSESAHTVARRTGRYERALAQRQAEHAQKIQAGWSDLVGKAAPLLAGTALVLGAGLVLRR